MKRILVTGGAGFLGSHLCEKLLQTGCEVICADNLFTGRKENIRHLLAHPNFKFIRHDITKPLYIEIDEIYNLWGLAFKPDTDDMRESPAIRVIEELTAAGAQIRAYDPQTMEAARKHYLKHCAGITYCENKYKTLEGADALLLITEWKEFRSSDFSAIKERLGTPVVFDERNQYEREQLSRYGLEYEQIGVRVPDGT